MNTNDKTEIGDSPTFDINEFKRRLVAAREALLQAEEFVYSWQEAEERKKNATPTEFQD